MPNPFDFKIFDNTIGNYILIAGVILLAVSLKTFLSKIVASLVFRVVRRLARGVDRKSFINLVVPPLENFVVILVIIVALEKLHYPGVLDVHIYKVQPAPCYRDHCHECDDRFIYLVTASYYRFYCNDTGAEGKHDRIAEVTTNLYYSLRISLKRYW